MLREVKNLVEACAAQRTALVVLSAGGLSAAAMAKLLASLGCDSAGSSGTDADRIVDFNRALFESSGTEISDWAGFNTRWLASPKASEFLNGALELLQTEFGGSYLSVMQDPGTARLLPFWNVVFDRAGVLPRYLFIVNDPAKVSEALSERLEIEHGAAQLIWLRSMLDAEAHSRGRLRAFVEAGRLNQYSAATVNSVASTLRLTFPRDVETTLASNDAYLAEFQQACRRDEEKQSSRRTSSAIEWASIAYKILSDWAVNGEKDDARSVLDALREAFDESSPIFLGIGRGAAARKGEIRKLQQELEIAQAEILRVQDSARRMEEFTKEAQKELQGRVSHLESELAQRTAEVDETWESLKDARIEISSTREELKRSTDEAQEQLRARYGEIVTLTRLLATETSSAQKFERTAERLGKISGALEGGKTKGVAGWIERVLPWSWHLRRVKRRLERDRLFDSAAYLRANPDVQEAGMDPLKHYLSHGAVEGRPLGID